MRNRIVRMFLPLCHLTSEKNHSHERIWNVESEILGLNHDSNIFKLSDPGNGFLSLSFLICKDEIIVCISQGGSGG